MMDKKVAIVAKPRQILGYIVAMIVINVMSGQYARIFGPALYACLPSSCSSQHISVNLA